jgi:transposase
MSDAIVVQLDDYRPRVTESMRCLCCGLTHVLRHLQDRRQQYFACPGCDETASVPEWSLYMR